MNEPIQEREAHWTEFRKLWPLERLERLTIAEYTKNKSKDSFIYWVEIETNDLGGYKGGGAFKFGIYHRDQAPKEKRAHFMHGKEYSWLKKYGDDENIVFANVMKQIVSVARAAEAGDFVAVEKADLGVGYKWKIAFLYQSREAPSVLPIFKPESLRTAAGIKKKIPQQEMYAALMAAKGDENIFTYADELWAKVVALQAAKLTTEQAYEFLLVSERFKPTKSPTDKMAGFESEAGLQLALVLENKAPTIFLSDGPWRDLVSEKLTKITLYDKSKPRNSNLAANASTLAEGNVAVSVQVPTEAALIVLCEAYDAPEFLDIPNALLESNLSMTTIPLNQILYGPPGTGKTYRTIDEAVKILDGDFFRTHVDNRAVLKGRFDELTNDGHIRFVTFHQSFSYEDFVEGLRANNDGDGRLRYEVVDGVFKALCDSAAARVTKQAEGPIDLSGRRIWKMSLGNTNGRDAYIYDECIDQGYALLGYGGDVDFSGCKTRDDVLQRFREKDPAVKDGDYEVTAVSTFLLRVKVGDLLVVTDGLTKFRAIGQVTGDYSCVIRSEGDGYGQRRQMKWLRVYSPSLAHEQLMNNQFSQATIYEVRPHAINMAKLGDLLGSEGSAQPGNARNGVDVAGVGTPKVLIIDEINRGNISRIFGELITLIEASKRSGRPEALEATLPYSKKPFSVPENLYLIGTMNTTDRSLAGLDIALRRRFSFIELPPQPELLKGVSVGGVDLQEMLETINERIEILLDRDHRLGHAYFMSLTSSSEFSALAGIFRQQILPLLQEYFFEDWARISWVLNDHRKTNKEHRFIDRPQNKVSELFGNVGDARLQDNRWLINEKAFKLPESYQGITKVLS